MGERSGAIQDLATLNEIAATLNRSVDTRSALERALATLIDLMGLNTGWIFLLDEHATEKWWGKGFILVAHHNLPPALALDSASAWKKGCSCQTLCRDQELTGAYNEVHCSRLLEATGNKKRLAVHASVALRSGEQMLGILNVAAQSWEVFDDRALALLANVGSQVGVALERARLFDMLREQRVHEQATLLDFTNQLLSKQDLEELMTYLVDEVRALPQIDACALLLPDPEDPDLLRFSAASGWLSDPVQQQRRVPADDRSGSGRVMRTMQPLVLDDIGTLESAPWMAGWLPGEKFKSATIVPLIADGRAIGALVADSRRRRQIEESELRFLQLMANQAALALEKARLHQEEIRRYRLDEELSVGRQIQLSMLPPVCPQVAGWDFAAYYEPARQVGGDFYDFFALPPGDDTRIALVVADVADKGVPAALFMALSRTTIRNVALGEPDPARALVRANELILTDTQTDLFLSAFYGVLEPTQARFTYCNAGHNPPLWYHAQEGTFDVLHADGIVLGVLPEIDLEEVSVTIACGDVLVFYTDGVTEAINEEMEEFGLERLQRVVVDGAEGSAASISSAITTAVAAHTNEMPRWDDLTFVVLKRLHNGERDIIQPGEMNV